LLLTVATGVALSRAAAGGQPPENLLELAERAPVISPRNVARIESYGRLNVPGVWRLVPARDPDRFAVVRKMKPVQVLAAADFGILEPEMAGVGRQVIYFTFSPKKGVVAYSEFDGSRTATLLDRRAGKAIRLDTGSDQPSVTFSPDGSLLATGGYGDRVRLWSVADGRLAREFDAGPVKGALTAQFSPDGRVLAVGNRNSVTVLFEAATGRRLAELPRQMSHELRFHPRGHTLAVAYVDGAVALWRVSDGALIREKQTKAEELYTVDWSPDGEILATAGLKGTVTLWGAADLSVLGELPAPDWVIQVRFHPDGRGLVTAGGLLGPIGIPMERWIEGYAVVGVP
jgi:WD40 repeat protein